MIKSIRYQYENIGVKEYYENNSDKYVNPHSSIIKDSFTNIFDILYKKLSYKSKINILDFACGDGIITSLISKIIKTRNYNNIIIDASDPFLSQQYIKNNNESFISNVFKYSFEDIMKYDLFTNCYNNFNSYYDIIIISFAIHLLDKKYIKYFLNKISNHTKYLLIISPTKNKGDFDDYPNIKFNKIDEQKFCDNEKKVFYKLYESKNISDYH